MSALLRSSSARLVLAVLGPGCLMLATAAPAFAQDGDIDGVISRPVVQPLPSRGSYDLNAALTRLAANPRDVNALIDAGNAAMALGDSEAAMGFLGRADQLSPSNPRVKATLASAMVRNENPYDAIPLFDAAERAGATDAMLAGDRGLAYDLVGDNPSAQRFYRQALAATPSGEPRDEITRRLALSLAIEGDRKGFEAALVSQLRSPDTAAWRTRAFGLAILGDEAEAVKIAYGTMPRNLADAMAPYLRYMARLTPAQQAAAANFGHFPRASQIGRDDPRAAVFASAVTRRPRGADAGLVPEGKPLGGKAANAKGQDSKASRKRKRDASTAVAVAAAPPASALRPSPAPTPTPAARPAAPTVRIAAATPAPVFRPPTVFTPAPSPTPAPSRPPVSGPVPQPSLTLSPVPSPTPAAVPAQSAPPTRVAVVTPPPSAAMPVAVAAPTPSGPASGATASLSAPPLAPSPAPATATAEPGAFDLAALGQKPAGAASPPAVAAVAADLSPAVTPASTPASTSAPTPAARPRLADIFSDFQPPEDEARSAVAAVDIGKIVAAKPKSADAKPELKADARGPLPGAPTGTRRSAPVETPASAKAAKAAGTEKAKPSAPTHPSRIWIQLAAGRDKAALGFDWRKQTRASADLFKARKGWTTPWGQTNRLLVGPFESQAAATTFLKELKKKDADAFVWTSPAGQAVDALAAK